MGWGSKLGRGLAMAMQSVGGDLTERSKEKRKLAQELALAQAKGAETPNSVQEYQYYVTESEDMGAKPMSYGDWMAKVKKIGGGGSFDFSNFGGKSSAGGAEIY